MKRLTSRDTISARALYKDPIEFKPTHTTIMHTNHLPRLNSLDGGTRRRIAVAPFPATLPPERVVTNFEQLLVQECGEVILRWIVEGARMFYGAGCKLAKPACVVAATEKYLMEEDWLADFLDERCEERDGDANVTELYIEYVGWAKYHKEYERSRQSFAKAMEAKGFERYKNRRDNTWYWRGIKLKEEETYHGI